MYNKILILLIFVSLILLLNYCSTILQEPINLNNKRNIENLPNPQKKNKKVRFNIDENEKNENKDTIDTFANKEVNPYSIRPQNSNDYIKNKDINDISGSSDGEKYEKYTRPEFIKMEGENINSAKGVPYESLEKVNIPSQIVYFSEDRDQIANIDFNYDNDIKPFTKLGKGSLFR